MNVYSDNKMVTKIKLSYEPFAYAVSKLYQISRRRLS